MAANGKVSGTGTPEVDKDYLAAVTGAKKEVETLLEQTKCVPLMLRLAYHDALTFDNNTKTGGANGSIRVQRELDHVGNESLNSALELLEPIKTKYQILTYAGAFSQPFPCFSPRMRGNCASLCEKLWQLCLHLPTTWSSACRPVSAIRHFGHKSGWWTIHQLYSW